MNLNNSIEQYGANGIYRIGDNSAKMNNWVWCNMVQHSRHTLSIYSAARPMCWTWNITRNAEKHPRLTLEYDVRIIFIVISEPILWSRDVFVCCLSPVYMCSRNLIWCRNYPLLRYTSKLWQRSRWSVDFRFIATGHGLEEMTWWIYNQWYQRTGACIYNCVMMCESVYRTLPWSICCKVPQSYRYGTDTVSIGFILARFWQTMVYFRELMHTSSEQWNMLCLIFSQQQKICIRVTNEYVRDSFIGNDRWSWIYRKLFFCKIAKHRMALPV